VRDSPAKVRERSNQAIAHVVLAGLRFGLTNCKLAKAANNRVKLAKCKKLASEALAVADKLMWKLRMTHPDFDQMMALSEQLKFEIESLKKRKKTKK
jgi:hypothetical protein